MSRVLITLLLSSLTAFGASRAETLWSFDPAREEPTPERAHPTNTERSLCVHVLNGELFMRTELLFGMSRSSGPDITEEEFQTFIDAQVTPRFPDGLTVISGNGQFKDASGTIVQEKSKLLVLLYPFSRPSSSLVEQVRDDYKTMFQQQSVLRIDEGSCVSF